jgi:hypothetical protein
VAGILISWNYLECILLALHPTSLLIRSVCKVRTQDPENFDEEVKSLLTAWRIKGLDRRWQCSWQRLRTSRPSWRALGRSYVYFTVIYWALKGGGELETFPTRQRRKCLFPLDNLQENIS